MFPPHHLLRKMQSRWNMRYPLFTVDNHHPLLDRESAASLDNLEPCKMSFTDELLASKFEDIERDIEDMVRISKDTLPPVRMVSSDEHPLHGAMPDYVEHRQGVNQVAKLSAEAVVREFDAAVKEIEALGAELTEAAKKCEVTVAGVHAMVSEIKELAASYRAEGKRYFLQIEQCSLMTSEVRSVCETLKEKIATTIAA